MVDVPGGFVLLANGGEAGVTLAKGKPLVIGNQNFCGMHGKGASLDFVPQDGEATRLSYTPSHRSLRGRPIVAAGSVEAIKLDRLKLYHRRFRFSGGSALRGFERWCEAGAVQHAALSLGDWTDEIRCVASLPGSEVERV
jgi:L-arabinose isomerase